MILKPNDINQILKGYIDAALWTEEERLRDDYQSEYGYDEDEDDDSEDDELEKLIKLSANLNKKSFESFTREDIEPDSLIKAYTEIKKFLDLAGDSVLEAIETKGLERLGHDIWFTRNGHGAGFFDHSYDDENEKRLIQAGKALGEVDVYINDNLKLSFSNEHLNEAKKTDYSKEKSQGLHGWFARKGGGGSSGWVDCNTCRKNPKTGRKKCKPCGRKDGEKRKYPACRPTPASCGTRGKGKKWGKKSTNENVDFENKAIVYPDFQGVDYEDNITGEIKNLRVSDCFGNEPNKGLNYFNTEKKDYVEKIIKSAKEKGIESFPPIITLEHPLMNGKYLVIDGNHRLGAFKIGGIPEIKAEIIKLEDIVLAVPNTKWVEGKMPETITVKDAIDNKIDLKKYFNTEDLKEENMKNLITQKLHEMVEEGHGRFQNYMFFNNLKTIKDAIDEILQMDANAVDQLLSDGHNWATDHLATSADDIDEVYHFLSATLGEHEPDSYDGETEAGYNDEYGSVENVPMNEAEYKGRKVQLGKPTRGDVKKYKVFVKNAKGKVVKVNFGDKNMEIKRDNPKRRKSFRARHKCAQAKDRTSPKYWSCRMWSKKPVSKIVGENFEFDENSRIFVKNENMTQPATKPMVPETKPRTTEPNKPAQPSRKNKPFLPEVAPGIKTDPKAITKK
jgi:hypothetical protein